MRLIRRLTPFFLVPVASAVLAKPGPSADPSLPKEVQPMHSLVGTWSGKARLDAGPESHALDVTMRCEPASGGFAILCRTSLKGKTMAQEETGLFGWDPTGQKYHWYAVTSAGDTHDHVADPPANDGDPIVFVHKGTMQGAPFEEVIQLTFDKSCDHFDIASRGTVGGQPVFTLAGSADRQ